ncbi:helix-turn-helix domain-containing protein [Streptomyces sp. NPDC001922]|uniref:helix-turn-helix domain-containing protein n=1 Tax=Streptomyces sp. NPDC001922 TaxID=3364624 RepID=UPI0036935939
MPRWRALPEELDPQVREFAGQLRRLVDRSGLGIAAVADRTGYSRTSWERYLNGRLLPPQRAVIAFAEVTGANSGHLTTMWELAERAWSRSEMRHDVTMEAIRVSQARAALEEFEAKGGKKPGPGKRAAPPVRRGGAKDTGRPKPAAGAAAFDLDVPGAVSSAAQGGDGPGVADRPGPVTPAGRGDGDSAGRPRRRTALLVSGVVGALLLVTAAVLLFGPGSGGDEEARAARPAPKPTVSKTPKLPPGVKCTGESCSGKDPETMGCGGKYAKTVADATVGTAFIEVRHSTVCAASWARITQAAPGDTVKITADGQAESDSAGPGTEAYTQMVAAEAPDGAEGCIRTQAGQQGCAQPRTG